MRNFLLKFLFIDPPPLDQYSIPDRGKKTPLAPINTKSKADEQGFVGEWKDTQRYEAVNVNLKKGESGTLDGYDMAALTEKLGERWNTAPGHAKAIEVKKRWLNGESAETISAAFGKKRGWGDRTLDEYISAFNAAQKEREAATQK